MNKIIVKKDDLGIIIIHPHPEKYGDGLRPYSECKGLKQYIDQGLEWFVTDVDIDKSDLESRKQLYHDGSDNIKKDYEWKVRLMPDQLIKRKHIKRLESKIDAELEKPAPDQVQLMKWQREKEKCCSWTECECYEQALVNLAEDGHDKPDIVKKLNDKIKELKK